MARIVLASTGIAAVSAYTGSNSPYMPGNWNLPTAGPLGNTFGADVAKIMIPDTHSASLPRSTYSR